MNDTVAIDCSRKQFCFVNKQCDGGPNDEQVFVYGD